MIVYDYHTTLERKKNYYPHTTVYIVDVENHTYARLETPPPQSHPNGFQQRSEKNTYTSTLPMAVNGNCDKQVQALNESGHEYEAPLMRKAQDNSDPSEPVYADLDRGTAGATRSASISGQRSLEQQQSAEESDPNNHLYHVLEQQSFTQHSISGQ